MSLFITFEGGEGCGKSVQARALYKKLSELSIPSILTYEPGGTPLSVKIGRWLKWHQDEEISPITELLLFNAARSQLVANLIIPSLKEGKVVICDRYSDSTTAYQSYGRGLELDTVLLINNIATRNLKPDITILLDIPVEAGLDRKRLRKHDRFEKANIAFHQRVRAGYLELAAREPERWLIIDANQPRKQIERIIWQKITYLLSQRGSGHD